MAAALDIVASSISSGLDSTSGVLDAAAVGSISSLEICRRGANQGNQGQEADDGEVHFDGC